MAGGAMGWTPREVLGCIPADFAAAHEGWLVSRGAEKPLTHDDVAELDALMERYPDG